MRKIISFFQTLIFFIKSKWNVFKFKMTHGSVFDKYELTPQGEKIVDYCLKVVEDKEYTYSDYAEMLIYEDFEKMVEKSGMSREQVAWITLSVAIGI